MRCGGGFDPWIDLRDSGCTVYLDGMEEIPFNCIVRLSMLMDFNTSPRRARHVVDTMSFGKALLQVQQVFKHLLGTENIVTDGFKALHLCPYPAGSIVEWVRLWN
jgi:hypothetical protein